MAISPDQTPPKAPKVSGCLQALGLSCSMLILLIVVLSIIGVKVLQNQGPHPNVKTSIGAEAALVTSVQDGQDILDAINHYHASVGSYPDNLLQLVPESLSDRAVLHSSLDPVIDPNHVSWTYLKPGANAPSDTVVLKLYYVIPLGVSGDKENMPFEADIALDGTTEPDNPVGGSKGMFSI